MSKTFNLKRDAGIELPDVAVATMPRGLDTCPQCSGIGIEEALRRTCRKCSGVGLVKLITAPARAVRTAQAGSKEDEADKEMAAVPEGDTAPQVEGVDMSKSLEFGFEDPVDPVEAPTSPTPQAMKQSIISMLRGSFDSTVKAVFDHVSSLPGMPAKPADTDTRNGQVDYLYASIKRLEDASMLKGIYEVLRKNE
jgi:hypothetical protein